MKTQPTPHQRQAEEFVLRCNKLGWTFTIQHNGIVAIQKKFTADSHSEFAIADMEYGEMLDLLPLTGGSVWGTDGGGIGGMTALKKGIFTMKKSGRNLQFLQALRKLQTAHA